MTETVMASDPKPGPRVLYVVYWGALEPLGRSLVLPAVEELADLGVRLTLVTFDKPGDLTDQGEVAAVRARLGGRGIRWAPLRYHKRPKIPATMFDILNGWLRTVSLGLRPRPDIIHARTFIGGLIGAAAAFVLRAKLVYHNEGFYPDEQVDGGVWKAGSRAHRVAKSLELGLYGRADGIVAVSDRGRTVIEAMPVVARRNTPVITVPSCVDLEHFRRDCPKPVWTGEALKLIYIGSAGGRYLLDKIGRFAAIASDMLKEVSLRVLTRTDESLVASMLAAVGLSRKAWSLDSVSRQDMPRELAACDAGLVFLASGTSGHGCSPTKVGEYWAMGLPVIASPGLSDLDDIIKTERVGVIVSDYSDTAYRSAVNELVELLKDPEMPERCRRAAERHYWLDSGCRGQIQLFEKLCRATHDSSVYSATGSGNQMTPQSPKGSS
ncbi:MAG TPA: glycosyltransferase [Blastocatellia bacterium]